MVKPPKPTEIKEKRLKMANRPRKTTDDINWDWEQMQIRAKNSMGCVVE